MAENLNVKINAQDVNVRPGTTIAAAVLNAGITHFRTSVSGEARGPVCGMGVCFECRVTVDGVRHVRACMVPCAEGMVIETGG